MRYFARSWDEPTRHAPIIALALCGLHTGEIGRIRPLDIQDGHIMAPGTTRVRARQVPVVDGWAANVLAERTTLTSSLYGVEGSLVLNESRTAEQQQAGVCTAIREVIIRAGLHADPTVRPASLTVHPACAVFNRSGRIEHAARHLGYSSPDATASAIGWDWRNASQPRPHTFSHSLEK